MTPGRDPAAGVSLVEVLVVLAIVGVMTGAAVLSLGALDRGARAETEARRLADRLQLAADEALVTGAPRALLWDARGYRFLAWDREGEAWRAEALPLLAAGHALPAGLTLAGESAGAPVLIAPDLAQPPVALQVEGPTSRWQVAFDGFAAVAGLAGP